MLILSRRVGEKFIIDDDTEVQIVSVKGNQVRIGITAPDHVKVWREELYEEAKRDGFNRK